MTGQEVEAEDAGRRRVEFKFPILTVRTQLFTELEEYLKPGKSVRLIKIDQSRVGKVICVLCGRSAVGSMESVGDGISTRVQMATFPA